MIRKSDVCAFGTSDVVRRCSKVMWCVPFTPTGASLGEVKHHAVKHIKFRAPEHIDQKTSFAEAKEVFVAMGYVKDGPAFLTDGFEPAKDKLFA